MKFKCILEKKREIGGLGVDIIVGSDGTIIENSTIQSIDGTIVGARGISNASNNVVISNCRINGAGSDYGIVSTGSGLKVTGCRIAMANGNCISSTGSDLIVGDNHLTSTYSGVSISPASGINDINITGNNIDVTAACVEVAKGTNVNVSGNNMKNTKSNVSPLSIVDSCNKVVISGNDIVPAHAATNGMYISDTTHVSIDGNTIGNASTGNTNGIYLANTVTGCSITGNTINYGKTYGIFINNGIEITITGDTIYYFDNSALGRGIYGTVNRLTVTGNVIKLKKHGTLS